jgi:hypothetical protein
VWEASTARQIFKSFYHLETSAAVLAPAKAASPAMKAEFSWEFIWVFCRMYYSEKLFTPLSLTTGNYRRG